MNLTSIPVTAPNTPEVLRLLNLNGEQRESARLCVKELLSRQLASEDLESFVKYTKPDWQTAKHHKELFEVMGAFERGEITRLLLEAPPRHSKTETASRRFPAWCMGRTPGLQVVCSTYNQDFANDIGREVRQIISSDQYQHVFNVPLRKDSKAADRFHLENGAQYVAVGTGSSLTGRGMDIGVIDDPVKDREDAESERMRNRNWDWFRSTFYTRQMPKARLMLMATRWHEDDLTGRILEHEGDKWHRLTFPAIANEGLSDEAALWPEWYPLKVLKDIRQTIGIRDWLSLYQQKPTTEEGTIFQREWLDSRLYRDLPKHLNYYMSGDFAVTRRAGDHTVLIVWGVDEKGTLYGVDSWFSQSSADVWIEKMLDFIAQYPILGFIGETGQIRRAIEPMLRRRMDERKIYTRLIWLPHNAGDKTSDSRSLQAMCGLGRVRMPENESWSARLIDELLKFPDGKTDDFSDTAFLMARWMDKTGVAHVPRATPSHKILPGSSRELRIADFLPKSGSLSKRNKKKLYL